MIDKDNCHILIISEHDALAMNALLQINGYKNIYKTSSSKDVLSIIEENTPDLVILNYHPLAENESTGIELFRQLKSVATLKNTAFLIHGARLNQEKCQELKDIGFSGVLEYPLHVNKFPKACSIVLDGGTYFRPCDKY
ncbi:response regulator [Candidatus Leptofilum sp.]|uniref:response regulator n=1 Tax=Candidatus Leptofilum sp. TaxID=3241576 RepID=UPI003B5CEA91